MVLLPQHDMVWLGDNYGNCLNICAHYHVLWNDYYICRILVRLLYLAWNNHLFVQNFRYVIWSFIHFFVDFIPPPLMFLSFCLLDVICCEGHCVLLENRWHSFSWSYLFIFIPWFLFWQMVTLVWCTVEFLKFILDTVYNKISC